MPPLLTFFRVVVLFVPANRAAPVIMIGPGTGIAPFRAFVEHRAESDTKGETWLFMGDQHYLYDFLYQLEWQDHLKSGALSRLDVAFSRDQPEKVYVQDKRQTSTRLILDNLVRQTGDKMEIEEDQVFYMTISQTIIDKNIEDHACKRYPTSDFKNYEECDINYMRYMTHDWLLVFFYYFILGIF